MNAWDFSVISARRQFSPESIVSLALKIAKDHGYSPINPQNGLVEGIHAEGYPDFSLPSTEQLIRLLSQDGGLVNLWSDYTDVALSFHNPDPTVTGLLGSASSAAGPFVVTALHVENSSWRPSTIERGLIVRDSEGIFADLCLALSSPYGYCVDEDAGDQLMADLGLDLSFRRNFRADKPPEYLFWLQYLSASYAEVVDLPLIAELGGKVEKVGEGIFVRFFHAPWEVDLRRLVEINRHWKQSGSFR